MTGYVAPTRDSTAFHCPHCRAFAHQKWYFKLVGRGPGRVPNADIRNLPDEFAFGICQHCNKDSLWCEDNLIFPLLSTAPLPVDNMPEDVLADFEEARQVLLFQLAQVRHYSD